MERLGTSVELCWLSMKSASGFRVGPVTSTMGMTVATGGMIVAVIAMALVAIWVPALVVRNDEAEVRLQIGSHTGGPAKVIFLVNLHMSEL